MKSKTVRNSLVELRFDQILVGGIRLGMRVALLRNEVSWNCRKRCAPPVSGCWPLESSHCGRYGVNAFTSDSDNLVGFGPSSLHTMPSFLKASTYALTSFLSS